MVFRLEQGKLRLLILASYGLLMVFCFISLIVGYTCYNLSNFPKPVHPTNLTTSTVPTTPSVRNYFNTDYDVDSPMRDYYRTLNRMANYETSPHFYIIIPCISIIVISCVVVIAEIIFKNIFTSSFAVFTSFSLMFTQLSFTLIYLEFRNIDDKHFKAFVASSISGLGTLHAIIIVILIFQTISLGWYLKQQDVGWPCFKLGHFFTFETLITIPRFTFSTIYVIICFESSQLLSGITLGECNYYSNTCSKIQVSETVAFTFSVIVIINVICSAEALLSPYFGVVQRKFNAAVGICNTIGIIITMVIGSKLFLIHYFYSDLTSYYSDSAFGTLTFIFLIIHSALNIIAPTAISTTPKCIKVLTEKQTSSKTGESAVINGYSKLMQQTGGIGNPQDMTTAAVKVNVFVFLLCAFNLLLMSLDSWEGTSFGEMLLFATNLCTAIRSLTFLLTYKIVGFPLPQPAVTLVLQFLLEGLPMLVGIVGSFINIGYSHHEVIIFAASISLLIVLFQGAVLTRNTTALGGTLMKQDKVNLVENEVLEISASSTDISQVDDGNSTIILNHV